MIDHSINLYFQINLFHNVSGRMSFHFVSVVLRATLRPRPPSSTPPGESCCFALFILYVVAFCFVVFSLRRRKKYGSRIMRKERKKTLAAFHSSRDFLIKAFSLLLLYFCMAATMARGRRAEDGVRRNHQIIFYFANLLPFAILLRERNAFSMAERNLICM